MKPEVHELVVFPVTRLYDRGVTVTTSLLLEPRLAKADLRIHPLTAKHLMLADEMQVMLPVDGVAYSVRIVLDEAVPEGIGLIPRSVGVPIHEPQVVQVAPPVGEHSSQERS